MAVDAAETRHRQDRRRQDQAVGDDDEDIGFESRQRGGVLVGFQAFRMAKLETEAAACASGCGVSCMPLPLRRGGCV